MSDQRTSKHGPPDLRGWLFVVAIVGIEQAYYAGLRYTGYLGDWAAFIAVPIVVLALLLFWVRAEGRSMREFGWVLYERPGRSIMIALALFATYLLITLETGLFLGFIRVPIPEPLVAVALVVGTCAGVLAQIAVFQGYFLRRAADRGSFLQGLFAAGALSALFATNLPGLAGLPPVLMGEYLFSTTVTAFVLAIVVGVYLYKSRWSLFGPAVFAVALALAAYFVPIQVLGGSWEITFLVEILAYSVVLLLLVAFVREPSYLARRYLNEEFGPRRFRFQRRALFRKEAVRVVIALAVLSLAVAGAALSLDSYTGVRTPALAIATGSMEPTLAVGDLVVIQHAAPDQIAVGTIIAFSVPCLPSPTVHRVVAVEPGSVGSPVYQTKGDANPSEDPCTVPYDAVLGKVVATLPAIGYFELQPAIPVGIVVLVALVAILWEPRLGARPPRRPR